MFYDFLAVNSTAIYLRYITVDVKKTKQKCVFSLPISFTQDEPAMRAFGSMHHDDTSPYILSEKEILLIFQASDASVKNDHKPAPIHANFFHRYAKVIVQELHNCNSEQGEDDSRRLLCFMKKTAASKCSVPLDSVPFHYF